MMVRFEFPTLGTKLESDVGALSAVCSGTARQPRAVALPRAVSAVVDENATTVCSDCSSFETEPMGAGEVQLFRLG